jgi:ZIP family zinc transporter
VGSRGRVHVARRALIAYAFSVGRGVLAVIMALGTGFLLGSVSFELVDDAVASADVITVGVFTLIFAAAFTVGNWLLARRGGGERKDAAGAQADGSALAIVPGSVLDGIPESFVLGLTVAEGGISIALLVGVLLSNLPEGMSSSSGLRAAGWARRRVVVMWSIVIVVSAISAGVGFVVLDPTHQRPAALVEAFAAGALLAMVADTLLPEAFSVEGVVTGWLVALGFAISLVLSGL